MPYTKKQQRAAGADLARKRAGKSPRTFKGANEATLRDLASGPVKKKRKRRK